MRRQRFVDREAEHDPRAGVRRAQRHRHGLVRHAADGDHAMARALLERRERHAREARHLPLVGRRAHDDRAVEVEQRRNARADAARMVAQHGANRRRVAAAHDGLLEPVVGDEHVDGRQELVGPIVHVLVEQHAGEADGALGLRRRVAFDEVEHREQHDELRRDDQRDGEQQNSVTKAVLFHAVAILRRPAAGLCAVGHGCALIVHITSRLLIYSETSHAHDGCHARRFAGCPRRGRSLRGGHARSLGRRRRRQADRERRRLCDVAAPQLRDSGSAPTATMDQRRGQFVPHMLVVQAGTEVTFPNSDSVSHHVYSFSPTKEFELPLYKGDLYPPVVFDQARHRRGGLQHSRRHARLHPRRRHAALRA